jgi:soluble lytic murein transglycosylase-like protein
MSTSRLRPHRALEASRALFSSRPWRAGATEYVVLQRAAAVTVSTQRRKYRLQMAGAPWDRSGRSGAIEPEEIFTPVPATPAEASHREMAEAAAARYKVDADLITSVIAVESNTKAVSRKKGARLDAALAGAAARLVPIEDPQKILMLNPLSSSCRRVQQQFGARARRLQRGTGADQRYGRVPPFVETTSYVRRVKWLQNSRPAP